MDQYQQQDWDWTTPEVEITKRLNWFSTDRNAGTYKLYNAQIEQTGDPQFSHDIHKLCTPEWLLLML